MKMRRKKRKSLEFIYDLRKYLLPCLQVGVSLLLKSLKFFLKNLE